MPLIGAVLTPRETRRQYLYSSLPIPTGGCGEFRVVVPGYIGPCIKVRRSIDNDTMDIGFLPNGQIDVGALEAFTLGGDAFIEIWYSQSTNNHMRMPNMTYQYRIAHNGVVDRINGRVAAFVPDTVPRGMLTNGFAAYTGSDLSVTVIAAFSSSAPTSGGSTRLASLLPSVTTYDDTHAAGLVAIARNSATEQWGTNHNSSWIASAPAEYNRLNTVSLVKTGNLYKLSVDGVSVSMTESLSSSFSVTRMGLGHTGLDPKTAQGTYIAGWHFDFRALSNSQQSALIANVARYHGTSAIEDSEPGGGGFDPVASGYTLQAEESFSTGWRTQDWVLYNYGKSTNVQPRGAWIANLVSRVPTGNSEFPYAVEMLAEQLPSPVTTGFTDGFSYRRRSGAGFWKGPNNQGINRQGLWRAIWRFVKKNGPGDYAGSTNTRGYGLADMLWPTTDANWPLNSELDLIEYSANTANKSSVGVANWHLDTVVNSGRAEHWPPTSGRLAQYPALNQNIPPADVTRGNFGMNLTNGSWQTVDCEVVPGSHYRLWVNGILRGRINRTTTPAPYVIASNFAYAYRRTLQVEFYNCDEANVAPGQFSLQIALVQYYALP